MAKFKCVDCGNIEELQQYSVVIGRDGSKTYTSPKSGQLRCTKCMSVKLDYQKEHEGFCTNVGTFAGMSDEDKKSMLKKRADNNFNKKMKEQHDHLHKEATKKMLNKL